VPRVQLRFSDHGTVHLGYAPIHSRSASSLSPAEIAGDTKQMRIFSVQLVGSSR
jgi:hypothetical protein